MGRGGGPLELFHWGARSFGARWAKAVCLCWPNVSSARLEAPTGSPALALERLGQGQLQRWPNSSRPQPQRGWGKSGKGVGRAAGRVSGRGWAWRPGEGAEMGCGQLAASKPPTPRLHGPDSGCTASSPLHLLFHA